VSGFYDVPDFVDDAFLARELGLVWMSVEWNVVAHRSAQQFVDRQAKHLAANVPQGDVDGAHAFHRGPAAAHVGKAAEDLVPQAFDVCGVFSCQIRADLPKHGAKRTVGEPGRRRNLAPPAYVFIRGHLDEQELAPIRPAGFDQPRLHCRYFHRALPLLVNCCAQMEA
jgi:hypothetical protein